MSHFSNLIKKGGDIVQKKESYKLNQIGGYNI